MRAQKSSPSGYYTPTRRRRSRAQTGSKTWMKRLATTLTPPPRPSAADVTRCVSSINELLPALSTSVRLHGATEEKRPLSSAGGVAASTCNTAAVVGCYPPQSPYASRLRMSTRWLGYMEGGHDKVASRTNTASAKTTVGSAHRHIPHGVANHPLPAPAPPSSCPLATLRRLRTKQEVHLLQILCFPQVPMRCFLEVACNLAPVAEPLWFSTR